MSKTKDILARLDALEARLKNYEEHRGPEDLFGRYYDELPPSDRWRWWRYMYSGSMPFDTLEQYEEYELKHTVKDLHFECIEIEDAMDFSCLDDEMIRFERRDFLGGF